MYSVDDSKLKRFSEYSDYNLVKFGSKKNKNSNQEVSKEKLFDSENGEEVALDKGVKMRKRKYDFIEKIDLKFVGFLTSFVVDSRGCVAESSRHSGLRWIIPPSAFHQPISIQTKLVNPHLLIPPPPLPLGDGVVSYVVKIEASLRNLNRPVLLELPHKGSFQGNQRGMQVLRSDGRGWEEHEEVLTHLPDLKKLIIINDLPEAENIFESPVCNIVLTSLPKYLVVISSNKRDYECIGTKGGFLQSSSDSRVKITFPEGAITKETNVGLQILKIKQNNLKKSSLKLSTFFNGTTSYSTNSSPPSSPTSLSLSTFNVDSVLSIEPIRRKFHKKISVSMPLPKINEKKSEEGNEKNGEEKREKLEEQLKVGKNVFLFSNMDDSNWQDATEWSELTITKEKVSFLTPFSARFCLVKTNQPSLVSLVLPLLHRQSLLVPILTRYFVYNINKPFNQSDLRIYSMTNQREPRSYENMIGYELLTYSPHVEVLDGQPVEVHFSDEFEVIKSFNNNNNNTNHDVNDNKTPVPSLICDVARNTCVPVLIQKKSESIAGRVTFKVLGGAVFGEKYEQLKERFAFSSNDCIVSLEIPPDDNEKKEKNAWKEKKIKVDRKNSQVLANKRPKSIRMTFLAETLEEDWLKVAHLMNYDRGKIRIIESNYETPQEQCLIFLQQINKEYNDKITLNNNRNNIKNLKSLSNNTDNCDFNCFKNNNKNNKNKELIYEIEKVLKLINRYDIINQEWCTYQNINNNNNNNKNYNNFNNNNNSNINNNNNETINNNKNKLSDLDFNQVDDCTLNNSSHTDNKNNYSNDYCQDNPNQITKEFFENNSNVIESVDENISEENKLYYKNIKNQKFIQNNNNSKSNYQTNNHKICDKEKYNNFNNEHENNYNDNSIDHSIIMREDEDGEEEEEKGGSVYYYNLDPANRFKNRNNNNSFDDNNLTNDNNNDDKNIFIENMKEIMTKKIINDKEKI